MFLEKVRMADGKDTPSDVQRERVDRMWYVLLSLSGSTDSFGFKDYERLETTMEKWYLNGKVAVTGHARGLTPGADLSHNCFTVTL